MRDARTRNARGPGRFERGTRPTATAAVLSVAALLGLLGLSACGDDGVARGDGTDAPVIDAQVVDGAARDGMAGGGDGGPGGDAPLLDGSDFDGKPGGDAGGATDGGPIGDGMGSADGATPDGGPPDAGGVDGSLADGVADGTAADALAADDATGADGAGDGGPGAEDALPPMDTGGTGDDVTTAPPPLFDLDAISDPSTAACSFSGAHTVLKGGVLVTAWSVSYLSWESIDGELHPILIRGFAARPVSASGAIPGVVQAHGLGGYAEEDHATGTAALLGMMVVAYTGPGGGTEPANTSEGLPAGYAGGYRMFDTLKDPRGSWFWGHAVAAMRGLTCLAARPDVQPDKLGVTGFSAGGVVSLMVAGVDPRVTASVPLSASGAWGVAAESPEAWQHALLTKAGLTTSSLEWEIHQELLDPAVLVAGTAAHVMMVNGSSDEFFPLTAHMATYDAIGGADKRTSFSANFDHGCYAISGVEGEATIAERADLHARGAQRMWLRHWLTDDPTWATVPAEPTLSIQDAGGFALAVAQVDGGGAKLEVESVTLWWSNDDAFLFGGVTLDPQGGGTWGALALFPLAPNTVAYADVQYRTKGLLPERFTISSRPTLPSGFIPHIRNIETCL